MTPPPANGLQHRTTTPSRQIGEAGGNRPGPTLVVVAALHGNELAGVHAVRRVLAAIEERGIVLCGRLVALYGNLAAVQRGTRFVHADLNRLWSPDRVELLARAPEGTLSIPEEIELHELAKTLDSLARQGGASLALLDLHTASSYSPPFIAVGDDPLAERIVARTGVIEVKGTSRYLRGMLVEHASRTGWAAMAFEAGQHEDQSAVLCHESMIWQMMLELGMIEQQQLPENVHPCDMVQPSSTEVSPIVEIVYRHAVSRGDAFRMRPGFVNFQRVEEGQLLAEDARGPVHAPLHGRVFLPLYQEQGDEGFFIVQDVPVGKLSE